MEPLDPDVCYRALRTRDARFDGRFFTAVRSTGIYCRPICPARTPRRENCLFLPCAAAAEEAGFRPCLRCRPEASPGTPAWLGTSATVSRGLRLIGEGVLDRGSVGALAARLGIGERHLRRLFLRHLGAGPLAVARTRRVLFAKQLIDETRLPMAEVAYGAGFASIRRFNDAIRRSYGRSPSDLRRARPGGAEADSAIRLRLPFRPPYPWPQVLRYLAHRATPGVEAVDGQSYVRSLRIGAAVGTLRVELAPGGGQLLARVQLPSATGLIQIAERLRRLFDLAADPSVIGEHLSRDPRLRPRVAALPGLRLPGAWDGFEVAVRAVLGQQVSVQGATTLAGRLAAERGEALPEEEAGSGVVRLFPTPESLAESRLRFLPRTRGAALVELARAVRDGELVLDGAGDPGQILDRLRAIPGVGEWTAQVVAMRALQEPDAFPAGDLFLRKALGRDGDLASPAQVLAAAERWRPWRAYAALYLWNEAGSGSAPLRRSTRAARLAAS